MARFLVMLAVVAAGPWLGAPVLSAAQRNLDFAAQSPDHQAANMKQHLERWLDVHRPDLSSNARALVREAIDVVTPEMYSRAPTEAEQQRQLLLGQRLACALGDARASTLMQRDHPPQRISQSWGASTREWVDWFVNCAGR